MWNANVHHPSGDKTVLVRSALGGRTFAAPHAPAQGTAASEIDLWIRYGFIATNRL